MNSWKHMGVCVYSALANNAKAPSHQHPRCQLNIHSIGLISYRSVIFKWTLKNKILENYTVLLGLKWLWVFWRFLVSLVRKIGHAISSTLYATFSTFHICINFFEEINAIVTKIWSKTFNFMMESWAKETWTHGQCNTWNHSNYTRETRVYEYSISQEICTRFCCALLCCGYAIVHNEYTWSIYPYSSGLLCWHWGNR